MTWPQLLNNEYIQAILILISVYVLAKVFLFIFHRYVHRLAAKTETDLDDVLLKVIRKPLTALIFIIGTQIALRSLSALEPYELWVKNIFFALTVAAIALLSSRVIAVLISRWLKVQRRFEKTPRLVNRIVAVIIYLLAALIILNYYKIEITPLIATLGLGGLAIGLALQNTLSNFFAGIHIISDQPIKVGDFIELDGNVSGYVEDIGWRSTKIRTLPNTIIIVPNAKLGESIITNDSLPDKEMAALVQCGVSYASDLEKVEKVTIEVARKIQKTVPGAVKTFQPFIRYHTFADSNINFTIILRVETVVDKYLVIHEFIKALKKSYDQEGIEISFPVRKVYAVRK